MAADYLQDQDLSDSYAADLSEDRFWREKYNPLEHDELNNALAAWSDIQKVLGAGVATVNPALGALIAVPNVAGDLFGGWYRHRTGYHDVYDDGWMSRSGPNWYHRNMEGLVGRIDDAVTGDDADYAAALPEDGLPGRHGS